MDEINASNAQFYRMTVQHVNSKKILFDTNDSLQLNTLPSLYSNISLINDHITSTLVNMIHEDPAYNDLVNHHPVSTNKNKHDINNNNKQQFQSLTTPQTSELTSDHQQQNGSALLYDQNDSNYIGQDIYWKLSIPKQQCLLFSDDVLLKDSAHNNALPILQSKYVEIDYTFDNNVDVETNLLKDDINSHYFQLNADGTIQFQDQTKTIEKINNFITLYENKGHILNKKTHQQQISTQQQEQNSLQNYNHHHIMKSQQHQHSTPKSLTHTGKHVDSFQQQRVNSPLRHGPEYMNCNATFQFNSPHNNQNAIQCIFYNTIDNKHIQNQQQQQQLQHHNYYSLATQPTAFSTGMSDLTSDFGPSPTFPSSIPNMLQQHQEEQQYQQAQRQQHYAPQEWSHDEEKYLEDDQQQENNKSMKNTNYNDGTLVVRFEDDDIQNTARSYQPLTRTMLNTSNNINNNNNNNAPQSYKNYNNTTSQSYNKHTQGQNNIIPQSSNKNVTKPDSNTIYGIHKHNDDTHFIQDNIDQLSFSSQFTLPHNDTITNNELTTTISQPRHLLRNADSFYLHSDSSPEQNDIQNNNKDTNQTQQPSITNVFPARYAYQYFIFITPSVIDTHDRLNTNNQQQNNNNTNNNNSTTTQENDRSTTIGYHSDRIDIFIFTVLTSTDGFGTSTDEDNIQHKLKENNNNNNNNNNEEIVKSPHGNNTPSIGSNSSSGSSSKGGFLSLFFSSKNKDDTTEEANKEKENDIITDTTVQQHRQYSNDITMRLFHYNNHLIDDFIKTEAFPRFYTQWTKYIYLLHETIFYNVISPVDYNDMHTDDDLLLSDYSDVFSDASSVDNNNNNNNQSNINTQNESRHTPFGGIISPRGLAPIDEHPNTISQLPTTDLKKIKNMRRKRIKKKAKEKQNYLNNSTDTIDYNTQTSNNKKMINPTKSNPPRIVCAISRSSSPQSPDGKATNVIEKLQGTTNNISTSNNNNNTKQDQHHNNHHHSLSLIKNLNNHNFSSLSLNQILGETLPSLPHPTQDLQPKAGSYVSPRNMNNNNNNNNGQTNNAMTPSISFHDFGEKFNNNHNIAQSPLTAANFFSFASQNNNYQQENIHSKTKLTNNNVDHGNDDDVSSLMKMVGPILQQLTNTSTPTIPQQLITTFCQKHDIMTPLEAIQHDQKYLQQLQPAHQQDKYHNDMMMGDMFIDNGHQFFLSDTNNEYDIMQNNLHLNNNDNENKNTGLVEELGEGITNIFDSIVTAVTLEEKVAAPDNDVNEKPKEMIKTHYSYDHSIVLPSIQQLHDVLQQKNLYLQYKACRLEYNVIYQAYLKNKQQHQPQSNNKLQQQLNNNSTPIKNNELLFTSNNYSNNTSLNTDVNNNSLNDQNITNAYINNRSNNTPRNQMNVNNYYNNQYNQNHSFSQQQHQHINSTRNTHHQHQYSQQQQYDEQLLRSPAYTIAQRFENLYNNNYNTFESNNNTNNNHNIFAHTPPPFASTARDNNNYNVLQDNDNQNVHGGEDGAILDDQQLLLRRRRRLNDCWLQTRRAIGGIIAALLFAGIFIALLVLFKAPAYYP